MARAESALNRVAGAAGLLAASVLIARALGFLRDALFAHHVGVGPAADAYFAAFMIPDILGYLLAAGASAVAVTPPYLKRLENQGAEAAARFAAVVTTQVGFFSVLLTAVLWVYAEPLLRLQFPNFDEATLGETLRLMRIVLPAQIFFLTGGVLRGVLMAHGRFGPQAAASVVYSAAPILGALVMPGTDGFAWGTLAGAAVGQWVIPLLAIRRLPGAVGRMRFAPLDADFREYVWLALPLMLGLGLTTVDEWYEKWVGAEVAPGAIAAITYARKLMMAPVGVVGQALGAALLPSLTALFQRNDRGAFGTLLTDSLRTTLGLGILASGALVSLALPIVRFLYERGQFSQADSTPVAGLLVILGLAVPGWVVQQVAVRGFYARGEMWRAMGLSTFIALAVFPLYWWGGQVQGVRGLAMASVTAVTLNALVTLVWLRMRSGAPDLWALAQTGLRTAVIAGLASFAAFLALRGLTQVTSDSVFGALILGGASYGVVAVVATHFLGDGPLQAGLSSVSTRIARMLGRGQREP
ncbi:MAG: murein biosynthesis integral membrane protein MurJ [Myxococcota bacterium]